MDIKKTNDVISCKAYVEDCKEAIQMAIDKKGNLTDSCVLPTGYEWCTEHLAQARWYLKSLWNKQPLPDRKTIMWY